MTYENEGKLIKNGSGRWEIIFKDEYSFELTSGCSCEVKIGPHWIYTTIEFGRDAYYATTPGVQLYKGQPARRL